MPTWNRLPAHLRTDASAKRRQSGRTAQQAGDAWENWLNAYHVALHLQGLAVAHKTGPAVRWIFDRAAGRSVPQVVDAGPADYSAVVEGRAVWFEAKTTAHKNSFTIPADSIHQRDWLRQVAGHGGIAFYFVQWRQANELRVHPIRSVGERTIRRQDGHLCAEGWLDYVTLFLD